MLDKNCNDLTTGLGTAQKEDREFADILARDFIDNQVDDKWTRLEKLSDELFFDEVIEEKQITFDETELANRFSFLFRDSIGRNSFAFSPNGEFCAIQTSHYRIDIYDKEGNLVTAFTTTTDSMIHSFYFLDNEQFVNNYFYDSKEDGPQRGTYYYVVDGKNSRLKTFKEKTNGEIYAFDKYGRKITWEAGKKIWGEANGGGYMLPDSEHIERLQYMKVIGDFLVCQTDLELFCYRIDNGTMGLEFKYNTFDSALLDNLVAFVDEEDDSLKILDLSSGKVQMIYHDRYGWFKWKKTFDKKGENILSVDDKGIVRVFNLKKGRVISAFNSLNGEEYFPTQIGYTADDKIVISGGFHRRMTKMYSLPGLEKYQSSNT